MKNDEAVSPVIGVILMVAITVILAAVIASFVFGIAGATKPTKVIAVSLSRVNSHEASSTYYGGQDSSSLQYINWSIDSNTFITQGNILGSNLAIGNTIRLPVKNSSHIIGVGIFTDGSEQVLITTTL